MYHHADQNWRNMSSFLSQENEDFLAQRISEYTSEQNLSRILIIYHGGEPLLAGIGTIERITNKIRSGVSYATDVDFSIQTNGTLLTEDILDSLELLNISVSLSIDGPELVHDVHRVDHAGRPSFRKTEDALKMLVVRKKIFSGVIAVIDPNFCPSKLFEFFSSYDIPSLDFLLPDANHVRNPPGRDKDPELYVSWLLQCFDLWFDSYPHIRVRFFDAILDSLVGLPNKTDALGLGDVSLLTIETDGSYHDLDVLKITYEGASNLNLGGVSTNTITQAISSPQIQRHRKLLTKKELSPICQSCSVVEICGGGSLPHRYSHEGFVNPSIYCNELFALVNHAQKRFQEQLESEVETTTAPSTINIGTVSLLEFEDTDFSYEILKRALVNWADIQKDTFKEALMICLNEMPENSSCISELLTLPIDQFKNLCLQPSVYTWANIINANKKGELVTSIDGEVLESDYSYVLEMMSLLNEDFDVQRINRSDKWLRVPFGSKIYYESQEDSLSAISILAEAYQLINEWDRNLLREIKLIAPEIQFIKDISAHPEKIVSFSDNSVPGALFVTIKIGDKYIDPTDLADSILHEYRHQKLYLLQRISDIVSIDVPLVPSPWREELRPPSGLFHALYVFSFLLKFWKHTCKATNTRLQSRARNEVEIIKERLYAGIETVSNTKLTNTGRELLSIMHNDLIEVSP